MTAFSFKRRQPSLVKDGGKRVGSERGKGRRRGLQKLIVKGLSEGGA